MPVTESRTLANNEASGWSPTISESPPDASGAEAVRLGSLVHHSEAVDASMPLEQAQSVFRDRKVEFIAVRRGHRVVGLCSRGRLSFIMSARFGFAIYSQDPVESIMVERPIIVMDGMPLRGLLERVFSREGDDFHEDVVLIDRDHRLCGLIKVETLALLQSRLVAEQVEELQRRQEILRVQNLELFRANHAARQSQGLFKGLFENHSLGVALLDTRGLVHQYNLRLAELLNCGEDSMVDLSLVSVVIEAQRPLFLALLAAQAHGAMCASTHEFTLEVRGRGARQFRCSTGWVREIGHVCACLDDVTEQRALERSALRQEKQMLLDTIVGGIAHELNNKLMPVIGYAELLSMESEGESLEYLEIIRTSVAESARIVRQLQELSRPSLPDTRVLDLRTIANETLVMLKFGLREAGCQVRTVLPPVPVPVSADEGQLKQVALNLVINALHAMEGRPQSQLTIEVGLQGDSAQLIVGDTGCGIPAANLARIFDPFFTTKGPKRGTGLGLSICAGIVRQHGGEIAVDSREGEGTRFLVTLPAQAAMSVGAAPKAPPVLETAAHAAAGARVLVVEDEVVLRRLMQEMLRARFGCLVDLAEGGAEALQMLGHDEYALVISDIRMPGMNGAEFFLRLREMNPGYDRRFVFVTGYPGDNHLTEEIGRCEVPVMAKPFTLDQLADVCRPYLEGRPVQRNGAMLPGCKSCGSN